jgi:hypothetical protein
VPPPRAGASLALLDAIVIRVLSISSTLRWATSDIVAGGRIRDRAVVAQQKTERLFSSSWLSPLEELFMPSRMA